MKFNFTGYAFLLSITFGLLSLIQYIFGVVIAIGKGNNSALITKIENPSDFWFFIYVESAGSIVFFILFLVEARLSVKK